MKVEVVIAHAWFTKGQIIPDMPPNVARGKIARGLVREVAEEEAKAIRSPVDRMMRKGVKK